jgi:AcrR family transcriptional regulator
VEASQVTEQARSERTRSRILQAAAESFGQHGYDATGVAEICHRARVSKGAFYHHFPSKQALFLHLLTSWETGVEQGLKATSSASRMVPEALASMGDTLQEVLRAGRGQLPVYLEFWSQAAHDPAVWQATLAPYRRYRDLFTDLIQRGINEGSLKPVHAKAAAQMLVGLALGLLVQALIDPQGEDWGAASKDSIQILLSGLERK